MSPVADSDLLIITGERVVVQRFGELSTNVEIRLDSRRIERRRAPSFSGGERRLSDRRTLDVNDQLRTVGWAFIAAAQRRAVAPAPDVPLAGRATTALPEVGSAEDESAIARRLDQAMLCTACLASLCVIPTARVERVLVHLQRSGNLRMLGARCEACRKTTLVYAPDRG